MKFQKAAEDAAPKAVEDAASAPNAGIERSQLMTELAISLSKKYGRIKKDNWSNLLKHFSSDTLVISEFIRKTENGFLLLSAEGIPSELFGFPDEKDFEGFLIVKKPVKSTKDGKPSYIPFSEITGQIYDLAMLIGIESIVVVTEEDLYYNRFESTGDMQA